MNTKNWHQIHKYIAIVLGVFLLIWTVSGIVMVLPGEWFEPTPLHLDEAVDYSKSALSPQQAVRLLEEKWGSPQQVVSFDLKSVLGSPVYDIVTVAQGSKLINANTGQPVLITSKLAERIARQSIPTQAELLKVEKIREHTTTYPFGELPVYRVIFRDQPNNYYYVTTRDGTITKSNPRTRLKSAVGSLHTFEPLRLISENSTLRLGLLVVASVLGILVTLTGYYIAVLPSMKRRQRKTKQTQTKSEG